MPYVVQKIGSKYVVRKKHGDRRIIGRHDSRIEAAAQLRAAYAAEGSKS
jgi:hypothetical protein